MSENSKEYIIAEDKFNNIKSTRFANNILSYCESKKIKVGSIYSPSTSDGTFLNVFNFSKIKSFGSNSSTEVVDYVLGKYNKVNFKLAKKDDKFIFKGDFEIIVLNNDCINTCESLNEISSLLKTAFKHTSSKGFCLTMFYSPKYLRANNTYFNSSSNVDKLVEISNTDRKSTITTTYYNNLDTKTIKTTNTQTAYIYTAEEIISELKKVGFKTNLIVNSELIENGNSEENGLYFIVSTKK